MICSYTIKGLIAEYLKINFLKTISFLSLPSLDQLIKHHKIDLLTAIMLILVAGVTGNLGKHLAEIGLEKGHQIRGFGRSPANLDPKIMERLESFVQCEYYEERVALDKAVSGVDAVICSYASYADAILDAQLSLLRAVERAGVKIYHAHSWNYDWTKLRFGDFEHYDAYLSFRRQAYLSSSIKPIYTFTGILGELALSETPGIRYFTSDRGVKTLNHWGDGNAKFDFTYLGDAARFSIDLISTNASVQAGEGGCFAIHSGEASAKDVVKAYEELYGETVKMKSLGGLHELSSNLANSRATTSPQEYFLHVNYYIQATVIKGTWKLDEPKNVGTADATKQLFTRQIDLSATGYLSDRGLL